MMTLIHQAIERAFEIIRHDGFTLSTAGENAITQALESALENRIRNRGEIEGFDNTCFGPVGRGSEVVNFDGTKISKKPDLLFKLRREHRADWDQTQDALFAECKPVDHKHKLKDHYCATLKDCTGIERFVIGHYAWAMEEALMIGYVRDGYRITSHLNDELLLPTTQAGLGRPSALSCVIEASSKECQGLYFTTHQRSFSWADGRPATPIDLYHSWHAC
ncbi:MAG: hypothetical protein EOP84_27980 [Verrucomicrobiaceae bacterium]|nr:MAG: hypothetical protein EOP84_27980 [Verrucomicrobiaceae bacterium]